MLPFYLIEQVGCAFILDPPVMGISCVGTLRRFILFIIAVVLVAPRRRCLF